VPPPSPRATRSSGVVPKTEEEQDVALGEVADAEAEEEFEFASDSSDDDYRLSIPDLPPRQHDHEVGGSSNTTDPAVLAILEGMRADQRRVAEEQARRDRDYWHFLASLLKIDYKSIISNGTKNVRCWYTITIIMSER